MQVQPKNVDEVEVNGTSIPVKGPSCIRCARMATCDIVKAQVKFFNETYPELRDETNKPLPENQQIRPFNPVALASICKYYAPSGKPDPLSK
jgi:hypothetical protein